MVDVSTQKPVPEVTNLTRGFWERARAGVLAMQRCQQCAGMNFYPKPWCVECGCTRLDWVDVSPEGTIYSHSVAYTVMMNYPAWQKELPVTLCIIDLDAGPRMYGQLTHCAPTHVHIGMRVVAYADTAAGEDPPVPRFRPL